MSTTRSSTSDWLQRVSTAWCCGRVRHSAIGDRSATLPPQGLSRRYRPFLQHVPAGCRRRAVSDVQSDFLDDAPYAASVVERYRHSYDVFRDCGRTRPFGSGATCVYPYRDLMIRNDTQTTFRLHVCVGDEFLEGGACRPAAGVLLPGRRTESLHEVRILVRIQPS